MLFFLRAFHISHFSSFHRMVPCIFQVQVYRGSLASIIPALRHGLHRHYRSTVPPPSPSLAAPLKIHLQLAARKVSLSRQHRPWKTQRAWFILYIYLIILKEATTFQKSRNCSHGWHTFRIQSSSLFRPIFFFPFNVVLIWTFTLWPKIRSGEIQSFSSRSTLKYVKIVPLLWLEIPSILLRTIFEELIRGEKTDLKEDRKIRHQVSKPIDMMLSECAVGINSSCNKLLEKCLSFGAWRQFRWRKIFRHTVGPAVNLGKRILC